MKGKLEEGRVYVHFGPIWGEYSKRYVHSCEGLGFAVKFRSPLEGEAGLLDVLGQIEEAAVKTSANAVESFELDVQIGGGWEVRGHLVVLGPRTW